MPTYKEQQILDKVCKVTRQKQIKYYDFIPFFDFQYEKIIFNCQPSHFSPCSAVPVDINCKQLQLMFISYSPNSITVLKTTVTCTGGYISKKKTSRMKIISFRSSIYSFHNAQFCSMYYISAFCLLH